MEDREGDIYDRFARRPDSVHLLVRAAQNRSVGCDQLLFEQCSPWSEVERHTITVLARRVGCGKAPRPERTTIVVVRFGEVVVKRPSGADRSLPAHLTLRVVDVRDVDPPKDVQERVHWCL